MAELPTYVSTWHQDVYPAISASNPHLSLTGKRIVMTGGAGGIGAAAAEAFTIAGAAEVFILGRTLATLEATVKAIKSRHANANVVPIVCDISSADSVAKAFEKIKQAGKIDVFVSNAGNMPNSDPITTIDVNNLWKAFEINVLGSILTTQAALKNLTPSGTIINTTSAAAHVGFIPGYGGYAISKMAGIKLFEYFSWENENVRVFNLQPGIIESTGLATQAVEQTGIHWEQQDTGKSSTFIANMIEC